MNTPASQDLADLLLGLVPADGASIGNGALRQQFLAAAQAAGKTADPERFDELREALIAQGRLGKGRGGSVHRLDGVVEAFDLAHPVVEPAATSTAKPSPRATKPRQAAGPAPGDGEQILAYRHDERRKNNPEVGMVTPYTDPEAGKTRWAYDPHLDPALQFDPGRAAIERLIDEALASNDADTQRAALEELKRRQSPYLNWTGKAERLNFAVDTVSLHVHERIDPMTLLAAVRKRMRDGKVKDGPSQGDFFRAWFEEPLPAWQAVEFYRHDRGWMNRLVAGDSLLVMNSLLQKEGMAGSVQMIYLDPPYNTAARGWMYNNDHLDGNDSWQLSKRLASNTNNVHLTMSTLVVPI